MVIRRSTTGHMKSIRVIVAVLALLLLVAGTAFATRSPQGEQHRSPVAASHQPASPDEGADESEAPDAAASPDSGDAGAQLGDDQASALVDLLKAQGIDATAAELKTLAAAYGVGGAVRIEAWAAATGKTAAALASMYDASGVGWGAFAKQLESADASLHLSPGIGWIMGHGHGNANSHAANAPGQAKKSS
jgi:hypothetical protein